MPPDFYFSRQRVIFVYMKQVMWMVLTLVGLVLGGCRTAQKSTPVHRFTLPKAPATMGREAQIDYLATHYWDHFPFADTAALVKADTAEMMRRFAQFVALVGQQPHPSAPMERLAEQASAHRTTLDYFAFLAQRVLHDPNSPLRSSELYIPLLEAQLRAPYYNAYERIVPEHDLRLARQNRIGETANDFSFIRRNGEEGTLHGVEAEHTLIFFSNPACAMCEMLKELLLSSAVIVERITEGRLTLLMLYPDEDIRAWEREASAEEGWIDARDADGKIRRDELYDLRAIPSIYLLDANKRVLVKDSTDPREVEAALR